MSILSGADNHKSNAIFLKQVGAGHASEGESGTGRDKKSKKVSRKSARRSMEGKEADEDDIGEVVYARHTRRRVSSVSVGETEKEHQVELGERRLRTRRGAEKPAEEVRSLDCCLMTSYISFIVRDCFS